MIVRTVSDVGTTSTKTLVQIANGNRKILAFIVMLTRVAEAVDKRVDTIKHQDNMLVLEDLSVMRTSSKTKVLDVNGNTKIPTSIVMLTQAALEDQLQLPRLVGNLPMDNLLVGRRVSLGEEPTILVIKDTSVIIQKFKDHVRIMPELVCPLYVRKADGATLIRLANVQQTANPMLPHLQQEIMRVATILLPHLLDINGRQTVAELVTHPVQKMILIQTMLIQKTAHGAMDLAVAQDLRLDA